MTRDEFKYLFDTYFDNVRNYVYFRSGDIDLSTDIAQEVFMRLWEKQIKLDPKKAKGLLYKMSSDMFISKYRRGMVESDYISSIEFKIETHTPLDNIQYEELKLRYAKALRELPEKQRTVFLMSRKEDLKYKEIAERLNISVKAVEKRMKNALAFLKNELNN